MRCGIYVRVSTDEQRDNGYSIDSQLRMIKDYCEKNNYDIVDIYNDAGYSGKDLMRPEMQRLLNDIKSKKLDKLIAIKVDRLTRNNYDGFWLLNYCEEHNVKIELILEPYDVSTANGEMIFCMNLVFGQRERKEIGARTKRAMEEMALEHVHPSKAPFGYTRNKETGHLEIEPIEAQVVKEIFNLCKKGHSTRNISKIMKDTNAYLKSGKWSSDRVYKILTNTIYIGTFEYGKYTRKEENILKVDNYCEPIIDMNIWNTTRNNLEKNKHSNYGEHIHLFTSIIKCPSCGHILSSTISYKYDRKRNKKEHYHLTCKNSECPNKGLHYSSDKIEKALSKLLDELTRYMYDNTSELIVPNIAISKELKEIDKALEKLKTQEKKLVDLYLSFNLNVETINNKNDSIKKEIQKLVKKKEIINPDNNNKEYTLELLKKLNYSYNENTEEYIFLSNSFAFIFDSLTRCAKKEIIHRCIASLEIKRDKNYNITIKNIKFTEEFISKNPKEYLDYLQNILSKNQVFITYKEAINKEKLDSLKDKYFIFYLSKILGNNHDNPEYKILLTILSEKIFNDEIIECPYIENGKIIDRLLLVHK